MKKVLPYKAETRERIAALPPATSDMTRELLHICFELSSDFPATNILKFPFTVDDYNNPFRKMSRWLKQIDFQPQDCEKISVEDIQKLAHFAEQPAGYLRAHVDSTEISFDNPLLCRFSQVYTIALLLSHLHVYNFLLENYIHESRRVRDWLQADLAASKSPRALHRLFSKNCPAGREYRYWVIDFLCNEAVTEGSAPYCSYLSHCFRYKYRHHHPVVLPARRLSAVEAYTTNRELAKKLRHRTYYNWLYNEEETRFFKELRNEHIGEPDALFQLSPEKLEHAVALAGSVDRRVTHLVNHRSPSTMPERQQQK